MIEKATREGLYQEIVDLAAFAQGLVELRTRLGDTAEKIGRSGESNSGRRFDEETSSNGHSRGRPQRMQRKKATVASGLATGRDTEYPRFLRDQDKLVKLGWSERDASPYEHRSPLEAVKATIQKIEMLTKKSETFRMEDVLPVEIAGHEIPSYQAYMALAWLRKSCLVDRSNKNSYVIKNSDDLLKTVDNLWKTLPTIASERKETSGE